MVLNKGCPACGSGAVEEFYECRNVPVNSVVPMCSREQALEYPRRDIVLGFCGDCGFIFNAAFEPGLSKYSDGYNPSQGCSGTFSSFSRRLTAPLSGASHTAFARAVA